jgi:peptidylprolyl isomerase
MRDRFIAAGIFVLGLAVVGSAFLSTSGGVSAQSYEVLDTGGPYLYIEVEGAANGEIIIDLRPDVAPLHVARVIELALAGAYDDIVFHRVIEGFMAQTGDVEFGVAGGNLQRAGSGGSDMPDLVAEFSDLAFTRGAMGMARSSDPDSANSQFFLMFEPAPHLNGQYTVLGQIVSGIEVLDQIQRGSGRGGAVSDPDVMVSVTVVMADEVMHEADDVMSEADAVAPEADAVTPEADAVTPEADAAQ